jgi:Amt family ammonium transporter
MLDHKRQQKSKPQPDLLSSNWRFCLILTGTIFLMWGSAAVAKQGYDHTLNPAVDNTPIKVVLDTIWVLLTACLVFFMNAGFAMLESGFCRHKNTLNLLSKNLIVFALASIAFWIIGFALMFGDGNGFLGWNGWFLGGNDNSPSTYDAYQGVYHSLNWTGIPLKAKFFFQLVFAGTAATIVSGAVAERIKFLAFIIFSLFLVGISYSITGHWIWGGGWLQNLKFYDFAGSTVVHSVGGWAALVGTIILKPRLDKYQNGKS